jgi:hypothetical protein
MSFWNSPGGRRATERRPHTYRPQLEVLDGRCLPSTVTNLNDAGAGSLRQAILDTPAGGTVDFQPALSGTITLTTGELLIDKDLTIAGPGAGVITVSGDQASRVLHIAASDTVAISGLTIADGLVSGDTVTGGGIDNEGMLTVAECVVSGNSATAPLVVSAAFGGGIANAGTLSVTDSAISGNSVSGSGNIRGAVWGGGIWNSGNLTVTDSAVSDNSANDVVSFGGAGSAFGGGITNAGTLTVTNSTVGNNSASGTLTGSGGGISNTGTLTVTDSTLSGNAADVGGGISQASGQVTVRNAILAGNTGHSAPDISGTLDSQGHNLIGDGTGGGGFADTDLVGTADNPIDPVLGPLQDNGGPTPTMALLPGSPAIDAGDNTNAPMWDQRGPGFRRIVNGTIDIGAFEVQAHAHGGPTRQPLPDPVAFQVVGMPDGSLLGQPPDLPGEFPPLPEPGIPERQAGQPGTDPLPVPTASGQQAPEASIPADAGDGQPGDSLGPLGVIPAELLTLGLSG